MAPSESPASSPQSIAAADSLDLRAVITAALAARPVDESALRTGVWTYVGGERHAGTPPGHVIMALTALIEDANISPPSERLAVTRRVILWCVESYFGHLGGDVMGGADRALSDTGTVRIR